MTRRYGRAPQGERVRESAPAGHWRTLTLLGAITCEGLLATMSIESPTDGDIFLAYLEQILCPRLQPGQVVVMDNLSVHKHSRVRRLIEQTGAQLLYLPPYSPDFNPIENLWSKSSKACRARLRAPWTNWWGLPKQPSRPYQPPTAKGSFYTPITVYVYGNTLNFDMRKASEYLTQIQCLSHLIENQ